MYRLIKTEDKARRASFETVHGTVQTPAFMNVATAGAIKGGHVQIIMEKLGGGGHLNVAGAQLTGVTIVQAKRCLLYTSVELWICNLEIYYSVYLHCYIILCDYRLWWEIYHLLL